LVTILHIGVLCIQGAVTEHIRALEKTFSESQIPGEAIKIRTPEDINRIDAIIIPGGESTTISNILHIGNHAISTDLY